MGLILFLARRGLLQSRLIMVLLVAAVAAAVGFQIPNTANMLGYRAELIEEGVSSGFGDVRLRPKRGAWFDDAVGIAARVANEPGVRAAVPVLMLPGAVGHEGRLQGAPVIGVDGSAPRRPFRLVAGELPAPGARDAVVLGSALARRVGVDVGDNVVLRVVLATGPTLLPEEDLGRYAMRVSGLSAGAFGAHESAFVDRSFLAEETGTPGAGSIVAVYADDHGAAGQLAARLGERAPEAIARAWMDDSEYLGSAVRANMAVSNVSQAMVIFAVAIPVLALLYIDVLRRRREVGVLTAIGFGQREIFLMFLVQALVVGFLGIAVGGGIGYALILWFRAMPIFEWEAFVIRPVLEVECFLRPALVVLLATLGAGVYPAWRASRIDPAAVLRGID